MPSLWKKALVYLGLADDEDYVEYTEYEADEPPARVSAPSYPASPYPPEATAPVRTLAREEPASVYPPTAYPPRQDQPSFGSGTIRTLPPQPAPRMSLIAPSDFVAGAKEVGDRFKGQSPVILNLAQCDRVVARRLLDYASGLTYGLSGNIKKVGDAVFLLTPQGVEVSAEEKRRYHDTGLFLDEE